MTGNRTDVSQADGRHDPLCEKAWNHTFTDAEPCGVCLAIRLARADERDRLPENGGDATWFLLGQRKGYGAAVRDAVDAVAAWNCGWPDDLTQHTECPCEEQAVAAIEALGGER